MLTYRFTSGVRAGETATIRDSDGNVLLTYRSFATVVGIVAALVAGIVIVAGIAATMFLAAEDRHGPAATAMILALAFALMIATLVPRTRVTLYDASKPALTIAQRSAFPFPSVTYAVKAADGKTLALLRRSALSRLGRNRWSVAAPPDQRGVAYAVEESLSRALLRKILGKFKREFESNFRLVNHDTPAGAIIRRPDRRGVYDLLEVSPKAAIDRRVLVALATLIFGSEP